MAVFGTRCLVRGSAWSAIRRRARRFAVLHASTRPTVRPALGRPAAAAILGVGLALAGTLGRAQSPQGLQAPPVAFVDVAAKKIIAQRKVPMYVHDLTLNEEIDKIYAAGHHKVAILAT